jgi:hypothetical protein
MDYSLESEIWNEAQATFAGEAFAKVVEHAVSSYRRRPGYASEERLHAADIGKNGVRALLAALRQLDNSSQCDTVLSYASVRSPLRVHLYDYLQAKLIIAKTSSDVVLEDHFMRGLNL